MSKDKQRTFALPDGRKVTIKSRRLAANCGYHVFINGEKYNQFNCIDREAAEDRAYVKWVQKQPEMEVGV